MRLPDALKETGRAFRKDDRGRTHIVTLIEQDLISWRMSAGEQQSASGKRHFTPRSIPSSFLRREDWQPC